MMMEESSLTTAESPLVPPPPQPAAQATVIAVHQAPQTVVFVELNVKGCHYSGITQIIVGMLSLVFGVVSLSIDCNTAGVGYPLWSGIFFIITGYVGCRVVKKVTEGSHTAMIAYATLTTFSIIIAFNMLVRMSQAAVDEMDQQENPDIVSSKSARIAIDCVIVFLSSAEIGAASWGCFVALRAFMKLNKHKKKLRSEPQVTTYSTMGNTTVPSPPYPGAGYQPIGGDDAPPSYDTLGIKDKPPNYSS